MAQLAIAWVLVRGTDIVPLVGARRREQLAEGLGALALELEGEVQAAMELAAPVEAVAGERHPAPLMRRLDSERRS